MKCKTFARKLYDFQDGTLTDLDKAEFEQHRSVCARCAAFVESESQTGRLVRAAVEDACEGLDTSSMSLTVSAVRRQLRPSQLRAWRIPAAIAAVLIMVLLLHPLVRKTMPGRAGLPAEQSVAEDRWAEEIQVTYETGLHAETTLISHDSGVTTIIEIQVSYLTR